MKMQMTNSTHEENNDQMKRMLGQSPIRMIKRVLAETVDKVVQEVPVPKPMKITYGSYRPKRLIDVAYKVCPEGHVARWNDIFSRRSAEDLSDLLEGTQTALEMREAAVVRALHEHIVTMVIIVDGRSNHDLIDALEHNPEVMTLLKKSMGYDEMNEFLRDVVQMYRLGMQLTLIEEHLERKGKERSSAS